MRKKDLLDNPCVDPTCEESKRDNHDDATNEKENVLTEQDMVGEGSYSLTFEVLEVLGENCPGPVRNSLKDMSVVRIEEAEAVVGDDNILDTNRHKEDGDRTEATEDSEKNVSIILNNEEAGHSMYPRAAVDHKNEWEEDFPLSEYEKLRERNIKERMEAMKQALEEIEEIKQDLRDNADGKRTSEEFAGVRKKRKKEESVVVRRSGREKRPVKYVEEVEKDGRRKKRSKEGGSMECSAKRRADSTLQCFPQAPTTSSQSTPGPEHSTPSTRTLRPLKPVDYTEYSESETDGYIWCSTCNKPEYNGCEKHTPYFGEPKEFNLVVERSSVKGKNVGDGVVNRGKIIDEGTLFGPYNGTFIPESIYKKIRNANQESGNAWEVKDKETGNVIGVIDPGVNLDPQLHWMAKINCPSNLGDQNLEGFQLEGQIWYRAIKEIPIGRELLVWYGKGYAMDMGINVNKVDTFKGKQNHTEPGAKCEFCLTEMNVETLEDHQSKGDNGAYKCQAKHVNAMIRMAQTGDREFVCQECGKGFKTKGEINQHEPVHSKVKAFKCDQCDSCFTHNSSLSNHKKTAHDGVKYECEECGKRFGRKGTMKLHYKTVHAEEKQWKCPKCGVGFGVKSNLTHHIASVHDKIRAYKCKHCDKSFSLFSAKKLHIEAVHLLIRYPCNWPECDHQAHSVSKLKNHRRRVHTQEWNLECQLCEDQFDIWWGCLFPSEMDKHRAKKHKLEWEVDQEAYRRDHPFICKLKRCTNRFATKVEVERHQVKMHT